METPVADDTFDIDLEYVPGQSPYTGIEVQMYHALDVLGVLFRPQQQFSYWTVDAWLPEFGIALEADGCAFHGCWYCFSYLPDVTYHEQKRLDRDDKLWNLHNVLVKHIWGHNLGDPDTALAAVRSVLEPWIGGTPD